jgi:hypothetical protein
MRRTHLAAALAASIAIGTGIGFAFGAAGQPDSATATEGGTNESADRPRVVTQANIDSAVARIERLRGPLDAALRQDTRILDTDIRRRLVYAVRHSQGDAKMLAVIDAQMDRRANPDHTERNPDADKRIHGRERRFGSHVIQIVNRLASHLRR